VALSIENPIAVKDKNVQMTLGQDVYAYIEVAPDGFANFGIAALSAPKDKAFMKCQVAYLQGDKVMLAVPIDRYYMQETMAPEAEKLYRRYSSRTSRDAYVTVAVKNGTPVIKKLYVAGKLIEDLIRQGPDALPPEPQAAPGIPASQYPRNVVVQKVAWDPATDKVPASCGDNVCGEGESLSKCPQDCGKKIFPYDSDASDSCRDSRGNSYSRSGENAAQWYHWGGCGSEKYYEVTLKKAVVFHSYTDSCDSCVCNYPDFTVSEYVNGTWVAERYFDLPESPALSKLISYWPRSDKIKVSAKGCFYQNIYVEK
jgi:hypothetical protein